PLTCAGCASNPSTRWPATSAAGYVPSCRQAPPWGFWAKSWQLRYDLGKLRAHGLVERIGTSRRYRLTARGLKLAVVLVTLRTRLLGPLVSLATAPVARRRA